MSSMYMDKESSVKPFLGGGAIFFSMQPEKEIFLSDLNEDLINTYKVVQKYSEELISELKTYQNDGGSQWKY